MYSIQNFKKMAELQEEFNRLKEQNDNIYHSTILPTIKTEVSNLFNALKDFFASNELEIADISNNKYQAIHINSIIEVEKVGQEIKLKIDSEEIDVIRPYISPVKYSAPQEIVKPDKLERSINGLQERLLAEKGVAKSYSDLRIKFINKNNALFQDKEEVIKRLFGN
ncbi:hypothetical protein [Lysinibacillus sphaericus]|uniref:Uncharacterized protein n=1 Tax=Lysinibacillus sphaericus OT4b.31 TaxID=1285586 RepID=R7ZDL4_LYSSH|nr:hypothetical protein [Lysinibacillus sphaericus]EON72240.1 hypothetical protein H131_11713 [Lysinibacillus sphaericus OT4b.31]